MGDSRIYQAVQLVHHSKTTLVVTIFQFQGVLVPDARILQLFLRHAKGFA